MGRIVLLAIPGLMIAKSMRRPVRVSGPANILAAQTHSAIERLTLIGLAIKYLTPAP